MPDLEIKMLLDRDQPKRAVQEHLDDAAKMVAATNKATDAVIAADRKRDASGKFVAAGQRQQAQSIATAMSDSADVSAKAFGAVIARLDLTKAGLSVAKNLAGEFGQAMEQAAQKAKKLADQFASDRDRLAELATVMGEKSDDAFVFKQAQFNQAVGFKPEEGLAYRTEFNNSAQQFKGKTLTDTEYDAYEKQAASLIAAKGFDPSQSGDLAGTLTGFKDRRGMGAGGSEDALGKLGSGLAILGRGKGRNSVLVNQFSMLASASLNEDALKGTFTDSDEVATAISLMAEKHDASAAEMVRAASRGFRDFDGKAKDLLARAGINAQTKFADSIRKLAPIVEAEAKAGNIKTQDVLKKYFPDQEVIEAIGTGINRGIGGGVLTDREAFAKLNQGPKPALDAIQDYQASNRGLARQATANVVLGETGRAAQNSEVDLLRRQAEARLTARNELDSTGASIKDFATKWATGGFIADPRRNRIDIEAMKILGERDPALLNGRQGFDIPTSIEGSNDFINRQMGLMRSRRIDPFGRTMQQGIPGQAIGGGAPAQAGQPGKDPQMEENNRLLGRVATALEALGKGNPGAPTPTLPPAAQPGPRPVQVR